jgi:hypothetical protein
MKSGWGLVEMDANCQLPNLFLVLLEKVEKARSVRGPGHSPTKAFTFSDQSLERAFDLLRGWEKSQ